jgi:hypothetical protein
VRCKVRVFIGRFSEGVSGDSHVLFYNKQALRLYFSVGINDPAKINTINLATQKNNISNIVKHILFIGFTGSLINPALHICYPGSIFFQ